MPRSEYLSANSKYWAQAIYDNPNPESYVFRIYGRILAHQFAMTGANREKILDFGCGSGGNLKFFDERGFDVFGVDQSSTDIARTKNRIPHRSENFKVIPPDCCETDQWFGDIKFPLVTAFQVLYYLDDIDLKKRLQALKNMMEPGGILVATMMDKSSWYYQMSTAAENGMRFVKFHRDQDIGREGLEVNDHYINFTDGSKELKAKFDLFEPIHTRGYYDGVYRDDQGSEKHLVFIGRKPLC